MTGSPPVGGRPLSVYGGATAAPTGPSARASAPPPPSGGYARGGKVRAARRGAAVGLLIAWVSLCMMLIYPAMAVLWVVCTVLDRCSRWE